MLAATPHLSPTSRSAEQAGSEEALTYVMRVTQHDVARAAGVHNSTVSLALRGSPTISTATRDRVRRIAASLGYVPDPAVQALVAYRNRLVRKKARAAIAFVTSGESESGWRSGPGAEDCFLGARARAGALGFHLDQFWAGEYGLRQGRLDQILFHRNITGVILLTDGRAPQDWSGLGWNRLSAVAIGAREVTPVVHRVMTDPAGHVRLAIRRARAAGYRRIGAVLPQTCDDACDGALSQALALECRVASCDESKSIFRLRGGPRGVSRLDAPSEIEGERLARWIRAFRPDIVLGWNEWIQAYAALVGLKLPGDAAFIDLDRQDPGTGLAGINQNHVALGTIAVDLVVQQMQQNLRGVPAIPTRTMVEGVWCDGASMPRCERTERTPAELAGVAIHGMDASIA